MPKNDYRDSRKQRNLVWSPMLDASLVRLAREQGVSVNELVTRLVEREVQAHGYGGARAVAGLSAASDGGGPRSVGGGDGRDHAGVGAGDVAVPVARDWMDDLLESIERHPASAPQAAPRLRVVGSDEWEPA